MPACENHMRIVVDMFISSRWCIVNVCLDHDGDDGDDDDDDDNDDHDDD